MRQPLSGGGGISLKPSIRVVFCRGGGTGEGGLKVEANFYGSLPKSAPGSSSVSPSLQRSRESVGERKRLGGNEEADR